MLMPRRIVPNISCISGMRVCGEVVRACLLGRAVCFRCHLLPTQAVGSGYLTSEIGSGVGGPVRGG